MITAHLGTDYLVLPENFEWELIRYSQLLSFNKLVDCVIPQITFPDDENGHNRAVLNQPTRFTLVRKTVKKYEGLELRSFGSCFIRGTLILTEGFSGSVYGVAGKLSELNQDKLISDYNLPEVSFTNQQYYYPNIDDFCCPTMKNQQFFAGIGKTKSEPYTDENGDEYEETIIQHKHRNVEYLINKHDQDGRVVINNGLLKFTDIDENSYSLTVVSPQLFLFRLIEKILKENGLYIRNNELSADIDLLSLFVYNPVDINSGMYEMMELLEYARILETNNGDVIAFNWDMNDTSTPRQITTFKYASLLPEVSIKEFLIGLQNLLNIAFIFNFDDTVNIVDRESILLGDSQNIDSYFAGEWELGEKKDVTLKFVQKHDEDDELFGNYNVDLSSRLSDFGADIADIDELMLTPGGFVGELRRVNSVQRIYEWGYSNVIKADGSETEYNCIGWILLSIDFQPGLVNYVLGKQVEEITTCFSTCSNSEIPIIQQLGKTNLRKKSECKFSPRLLFYTGYYTGQGGAVNNTVNYSLKYTGSKNMLDTRWKYFAPWWAKRQAVTGYAKFPSNFFKNFDINKKISTREGEVLAERTTTKITHSGLGLTKIDGYKVE